MRQELDDALYKKYTKIFKLRHASMQSTCMCWGFECGDGWYNILDNMCDLIQHHIDNSRRERARVLWYNRDLKRGKEDNEWLVNKLSKQSFHKDPEKVLSYAVEKAHSMLVEGFKVVPEAIPQVYAGQVKEKFATLRFYYSGGDEYISGIVSMAVAMSGVTCETCGDPGKTVGHGYIYTACDKHRPQTKQGKGE